MMRGGAALRLFTKSPRGAATVLLALLALLAGVALLPAAPRGVRASPPVEANVTVACFDPAAPATLLCPSGTVDLRAAVAACASVDRCVLWLNRTRTHVVHAPINVSDAPGAVHIRALFSTAENIAHPEDEGRARIEPAPVMPAGSVTGAFLVADAPVNATLRLEDLHVTGFNSTGNATLSGAIVVNNSTLVLMRSRFSQMRHARSRHAAEGPDDFPALGAAVSVGGAWGRLRAVDSVFDNNEVTCMDACGNFTSKCDMDFCQAGGGAVAVLSTTETSSLIENCSFHDNAAWHFGGALATAFGGQVDVVDSTFESNQVCFGFGGAVIVAVGSTLNVEHSRFLGNFAPQAGMHFVVVDGGILNIGAGASAGTTVFGYDSDMSQHLTKPTAQLCQAADWVQSSDGYIPPQPHAIMLEASVGRIRNADFLYQPGAVNGAENATLRLENVQARGNAVPRVPQLIAGGLRQHAVFVAETLFVWNATLVDNDALSMLFAEDHLQIEDTTLRRSTAYSVAASWQFVNATNTRFLQNEEYIPTEQEGAYWSNYATLSNFPLLDAHNTRMHLLGSSEILTAGQAQIEGCEFRNIVRREGVILLAGATDHLNPYTTAAIARSTVLNNEIIEVFHGFDAIYNETDMDVAVPVNNSWSVVDCVSDMPLAAGHFHIFTCEELRSGEAALWNTAHGDGRVADVSCAAPGAAGAAYAFCQDSLFHGAACMNCSIDADTGLVSTQPQDVLMIDAHRQSQCHLVNGSNTAYRYDVSGLGRSVQDLLGVYTAVLAPGLCFDGVSNLCDSGDMGVLFLHSADPSTLAQPQDELLMDTRYVLTTPVSRIISDEFVGQPSGVVVDDVEFAHLGPVAGTLAMVDEFLLTIGASQVESIFVLTAELRTADVDASITSVSFCRFTNGLAFEQLASVLAVAPEEHDLVRNNFGYEVATNVLKGTHADGDSLAVFVASDAYVDMFFLGQTTSASPYAVHYVEWNVQDLLLQQFDVYCTVAELRVSSMTPLGDVNLNGDDEVLFALPDCGTGYYIISDLHYVDSEETFEHHGEVLHATNVRVIDIYADIMQQTDAFHGPNSSIAGNDTIAHLARATTMVSNFSLDGTLSLFLSGVKTTTWTDPTNPATSRSGHAELLDTRDFFMTMLSLVPAASYSADRVAQGVSPLTIRGRHIVSASAWASVSDTLPVDTGTGVTWIRQSANFVVAGPDYVGASHLPTSEALVGDAADSLNLWPPTRAQAAAASSSSLSSPSRSGSGSGGVLFVETGLCRDDFTGPVEFMCRMQCMRNNTQNPSLDGGVSLNITCEVQKPEPEVLSTNLTCVAIRGGGSGSLSWASPALDADGLHNYLLTGADRANVFPGGTADSTTVSDRTVVTVDMQAATSTATVGMFVSVGDLVSSPGPGGVYSGQGANMTLACAATTVASPTPPGLSVLGGSSPAAEVVAKSSHARLPLDNGDSSTQTKDVHDSRVDVHITAVREFANMAEVDFTVEGPPSAVHCRANWGADDWYSPDEFYHTYEDAAAATGPHAGNLTIPIPANVFAADTNTTVGVDTMSASTTFTCYAQRNVDMLPWCSSTPSSEESASVVGEECCPVLFASTPVVHPLDLDAVEDIAIATTRTAADDEEENMAGLGRRRTICTLWELASQTCSLRIAMTTAAAHSAATRLPSLETEVTLLAAPGTEGAYQLGSGRVDLDPYSAVRVVSTVGSIIELASSVAVLVGERSSLTFEGVTLLLSRPTPGAAMLRQPPPITAVLSAPAGTISFVSVTLNGSLPRVSHYVQPDSGNRAHKTANSVLRSPAVVRAGRMNVSGLTVRLFENESTVSNDKSAQSTAPWFEVTQLFASDLDIMMSDSTITSAADAVLRVSSAAVGGTFFTRRHESYAEVDGLTVRNVSVRGSVVSLEGLSAESWLTDSVFSNVWSMSSACLHSTDITSTLSVRGTRFVGCRSENASAAAVLTSSTQTGSDLTLTSCDFRNNTVGPLRSSKSTITSPIAHAIHVGVESAMISNSSFTDNPQPGAVFLTQEESYVVAHLSGNLRMESNSFSYPTAAEDDVDEYLVPVVSHSTSTDLSLLLLNTEILEGDFRFTASNHGQFASCDPNPFFVGERFCDSSGTCEDNDVDGFDIGVNCYCASPLTGDATTGACIVPPGEISIVPNPLLLGTLTKPTGLNSSTFLVNVGSLTVEFRMTSLSRFCDNDTLDTFDTADLNNLCNATTLDVVGSSILYNSVNGSNHGWTFLDENGKLKATGEESSFVVLCSYVEARFSMVTTNLTKGDYVALFVLDSEAEKGASLAQIQFTVDADAVASQSSYEVYAHGRQLQAPFSRGELDASSMNNVTSGTTLLVRVLPTDMDGLLIPDANEEFTVELVEDGTAETVDCTRWVGASVADVEALAGSDQGATIQADPNSHLFRCFSSELRDTRPAGAHSVAVFLGSTAVENETWVNMDCRANFLLSAGECTCGFGDAIFIPSDDALATCEPCSISTPNIGYKNWTGDGPCAQCTTGREIANQHRTTCLCADPTQRNQNGTCQCPPGYSSGTAAGECDLCKVGFWKDTIDDTSCEQCTNGRTTEETGSTTSSDCLCAKGEYYSFEDSTNGEGQCVQCPSSLSCKDPGLNVSSVGIENGFWRQSAESETILACPVEKACIGNGREGVAKNDICREGHEGFYCSTCQQHPKKYYKEYNGLCELCSSDSLRNSYILIAVAAVLGAVFLYHVIKYTTRLAGEMDKADGERSVFKSGSLFDHLEKSMLTYAEKGVEKMRRMSSSLSPFSVKSEEGKSGEDSGAEGSDTEGGGERKGGDPGAAANAKGGTAAGSGTAASGGGRKGFASQQLVVKLKQMLVFFQIIVLFQSVYAVQFPALYTDFLALFTFLNLDWFQFARMDCIQGGFGSKLVLSTTTPLAVTLLLYLAYLASWWKNGGQSASHKFLRNTLVNVWLLFTYIIFPSTTTTIFQTFACEDFARERRLRADYQVDCRSPRYNELFAYAMCMIVLYVIGIPATYMVLLWQARHDLNPSALDPAIPLGRAIFIRESRCTHVKFLFDAYKPKYFWFEVFECARKLALTGFVVFLWSGSVLQSFLGTLVSIISLGVYAYARPYLMRSNNWLAIFANTQITLTLLGIMLIQVYGSGSADSETGGLEYAYKPRDVAIFLLVSTIAVLSAGAFLIMYSCCGKASERDLLEAGYLIDATGAVVVDESQMNKGAKTSTVVANVAAQGLFEKKGAAPDAAGQTESGQRASQERSANAESSVSGNDNSGEEKSSRGSRTRSPLFAVGALSSSAAPAAEGAPTPNADGGGPKPAASTTSAETMRMRNYMRTPDMRPRSAAYSKRELAATVGSDERKSGPQGQATDGGNEGDQGSIELSDVYQSSPSARGRRPAPITTGSGDDAAVVQMTENVMRTPTPTRDGSDASDPGSRSPRGPGSRRSSSNSVPDGAGKKSKKKNKDRRWSAGGLFGKSKLENERSSAGVGAGPQPVGAGPTLVPSDVATERQPTGASAQHGVGAGPTPVPLATGPKNQRGGLARRTSARGAPAPGVGGPRPVSSTTHTQQQPTGGVSIAMDLEAGEDEDGDDADDDVGIGSSLNRLFT